MRIIPVVVLGLVSLAGCAAKPTVRPDAPLAPIARADKPLASSQNGKEGEGRRSARQIEPQPIFYELDSAILTEASQRTLTELAAVLREDEGPALQIAGHTCELGTTEYNLALGMRRAGAARDYLKDLGVEPSRIEIISFGEERPALAGESEQALRSNRRSEFKVATGGGGSAGRGRSVRTASAGSSDSSAQN